MSESRQKRQVKFDELQAHAQANGQRLSISKTWNLVNRHFEGVIDPHLYGRTDYADPTGNTAVKNLTRKQVVTK